MMKLNEIYNEFSVGSEGFVRAVETHCGFCISREEIERIALIAPTAEDFQNVFDNVTSWTDANNV